MIKQHLKNVKLKSKYTIARELERYNAATNIQKLACSIDERFEVIPTDNKGTLLELFSSLKEAPLNCEEEMILEEIVQYS